MKLRTKLRVATTAFVLLTALLVGATAVGAQDAPVEDGRFDDAVKVDDGYVISGTLQPAGGTLDGYATKVDEDGDEIWSFLRGEDGVDYLSSVVETEDGYLFAGAKGAPNKHVKGNAWILKTDREGNVEWENTYAGQSRSSFYTVQALEDGYMAMGSSNEDDGIIIRLNEDGEELWNRSHGIVIGDSRRTEDGFLIGGGKLGSSGLVTWLAEIDEEGEVLWERTYDAGTNRFSTILPVGSGYLLGTHRSNEVIKVGEEGEHEWTTEVEMQYVYDIERIEEDRFAVGGGIPATASRTTSVVEIDSEGETIRERNFGYSITEVLNPEVEEGEYVVVAQGVQNDALAVVLEPDETAESQGEGTESGDGGGEGDEGDDGGDGTGSEGETSNGPDDTTGDANPLGSPAQTALRVVGFLVLIMLALGYRRR